MIEEIELHEYNEETKKVEIWIRTQEIDDDRNVIKEISKRFVGIYESEMDKLKKELSEINVDLELRIKVLEAAKER